ncbi:MAG: pyruvate:ferredoxin (flavodoxin) oxidoreductase [Lachnospiraceae bacterium]|nr:pyruvate:ferredoxin (flavodoxin) oxidoreductase [Lachnospiraceae bacterium]
MSNGKKATMDGNTAAAHVSYAFTEVAAIYPITPSSPMAEHIDEWAASGRRNLFGQTVLVKEMQAEGGAAGALHGTLQGGAYASTYTASQGLLLMIPNMYKIAGELLPAVFHVSARSLASNALSIFGDHQDVMSTRQTGFTLLASSNVQQCMDLGAVAHLSAIRSSLPVLHFFDGFRTSHEEQKIDVLDYDDLAPLVDWDAVKAFRAHALNPDHPVLRGTTQNPDIFFQVREAVNKFYEPVPDTVQHYMDEIRRLTGRDYKLFHYYGAEDAENVIVAMGSGCDVIKETIDYLAAKGEKVGLVEVHLYRPFAGDRLLAAIPASARRITVLDRTKEPGAGGEPLYLDVRNAFYGSGRSPLILGGRYGLASKDFTPADVIAVVENMKAERPKTPFTVGIVDDVTGLSLSRPSYEADTAPVGTASCQFWGLGSDGTVSANKSACKIIGDHTEKYVQAYFEYDAKKSGGLTISHLRFGDTPIRSSYLIHTADYVACHNQAYVRQYDMADSLKTGGIFLLNCIWSPEELERELPASMKRMLAKKKARFYTIDAVNLAKKIGLGGRINMIMQAAFFQLTQIMPMEAVVEYLKAGVAESYGRKGQDVVDKNYRAIEEGRVSFVEIPIPAAWAEAEEPAAAVDPDMPDFVRDVVVPMNRQRGNDLPVSAFHAREDGTFPTGITYWEKRGIAIDVPYWDSLKCIQCNKCAFACPHAVLRPVLMDEAALAKAPEGIPTANAVGFEGYRFHMAMSPLDCTGCGNCVDVCPAKEKALSMEPVAPHREELVAQWEYCKDIDHASAIDGRPVNVKNSQFLQPLEEFSGACAGCGETPYAKLITQLFGDRMMISNAAGCSTVWGGQTPSISYTKNRRGHGPSWGFSLFEDNAEYGLGMSLGANRVREGLKGKAEAALKAGVPAEAAPALQAWLDRFKDGADTRKRADALIDALEKVKGTNVHLDEILERKDYLVKRSHWVFGGDGWAYDIGYGGLDHVLASGEDINVLVFDTEVYSNTGGQSSKSTPTAAIAKFAASGKKTRKKDLGMMAMSYGYVYVAQIAMGADNAQTLKAIQEAESYPGPSLIIAYAPCINHGLKMGMGKTQYQAKRAVEAGYWSLYRFNPLLKEQGKNPFTLDSKDPTADFREFLMSEVRYASLFKAFPDAAEELFAKAEQDAKDRIASYKRLATCYES